MTIEVYPGANQTVSVTGYGDLDKAVVKNIGLAKQALGKGGGLPIIIVKNIVSGSLSVGKVSMELFRAGFDSTFEVVVTSHSGDTPIETDTFTGCTVQSSSWHRVGSDVVEKVVLQPDSLVVDNLEVAK